MSKTGGLGPNHSRASQPATGSSKLAPAKPQSQVSVEKATANRPLRAPNTPLMKLDNPDIKSAPVREAHLDMIDRLEPLIEAQVAEVMAVMDAEGLGPEDVQVLFASDTNGDEKMVCSFCGREGCGYRPVMYKTKNVEIDLLEDAYVVSQEVSTRLGISFGAIVYDQEVLVLREVEPPGERAAQDNSTALNRFRAFVNRHEYPDPTNRDWLDQRLAAWRPEHATTTVKGLPNDKDMFRISEQLLKKTPTEGIRGLTLSKAQIPASSLRAQEPMFKAKKLRLHGLAVGDKAPQISQSMFRNTDQVPDAHEAREMVGKRITTLIKKTVGQ